MDCKSVRINENSKSYTTPAFSRVGGDFMASENNTDSYQAPPPRSNKRAARCNATWSFITGNHVVWWLESYHHCGSTKKYTVMAYTLALRHLLIHRVGSRWSSAGRRPVSSPLLPAELQLMSEQWLAQHRDTVLNSDIQPVVLRPRRNSGWRDAVRVLSR